MSIKLSTVSGDVTINDLGARTFTHPTVDYDLITSGEFTEEEIKASANMQAAVTANQITLKDGNGNLITTLSTAGPHTHTEDAITFSGTGHAHGGSTDGEKVSYLNLNNIPSTFTPSTHASSHQSGGGDAIKLDDLAATDDNTDLNASASKHGLLPKLSGSASEYLSGAGTWVTPSGANANPYHGIETSGALSFNNSTHELTIASGANKYWYKGTSYSTASAIVCDLDSYVTLTTNTLYYVYFDDATGTLKASASLWNLKEKVPVAIVFWNGSAGAVYQETHNYTRNLDWHIWAHTTVGARYGSGLSQTNPTTANDALLQIESGTIYDEDLVISIAQQTTMRGWYKASASVYTFADYAFPYLGTSGQPQYLKSDTYTLTNIASGKYGCFWVYATSDKDRPIAVIPTHATADYNGVSDARAETPPSLAGLNLNPEWKLIYRWIYKGDGNYQEGYDYRLSSPLPSGGISAVNASSVIFTPAGTIAATNVQAAIEELDSENVFGKSFNQGSSDGESTTSSTSYQQKLRVTTGTLPVGTYLIQWSCEFYDSTGYDTAGIRLQIDDTTTIAQVYNYDDYNIDYKAAAGIYYHSQGSAAAINIDMDFRARTIGGSTCYIRRARIVLFRVS